MTTKVEKHTYYSLEDFAKVAEAHKHEPPDHNPSEWYGGVTVDGALDLIKVGWADGLTEAMPIAESALSLVETCIPSITFNAHHDVTGCEVDIGRYLQGVPENMIEYEPVTISRVGRIITLCASVAVSGVVDAKSVMRRGAAITALCLALERTGHETELWADQTVKDSWNGSGQMTQTRILVKGAHDVVDPERIAYVFAHPSMLRRLCFAEQHSFKPATQQVIGTGVGYGLPAKPIKDLAEGTIYLPELKSSSDVPDPERLIMDTLRDIGLVA